jgi:hypothetical protein
LQLLTLIPLMRTLTALALLLSAVATHEGVVPGNQVSPSFAGHWVLTSISPQRPAYDQFWFGTEARVAQTDTTLVITRVSPAPQREARFTFGAEVRNEYIVEGTANAGSRTSCAGHSTPTARSSSGTRKSAGRASVRRS